MREGVAAREVSAQRSPFSFLSPLSGEGRRGGGERGEAKGNEFVELTFSALSDEASRRLELRVSSVSF